MSGIIKRNNIIEIIIIIYKSKYNSYIKLCAHRENNQANGIISKYVNMCFEIININQRNIIKRKSIK
jgi:hypothetical protein